MFFSGFIDAAPLDKSMIDDKPNGHGPATKRAILAAPVL